jgi:hypothetical protein
MGFDHIEKHLAKAIPEFGLNNLVELNISYARHYLDKLTDIEPLKDMKVLQTLYVWVLSLGYSALEGVSFPSVTKLTFKCTSDFKHDRISIGWFLSLFPSLEHLDIKSRRTIKLGEFNQLKENKYPNLREINIRKSKVYPSFYTFIKHAAENLKILNVRTFVCYSSNEKGHPIDLTGLKLKRFHLQLFRKGTHDKGAVGHVTIKDASQTFLFYSPGERVLVCPDQDVDEKMSMIATVSVT